MIYYKNILGKGRNIIAMFCPKFTLPSEEDYAEYDEERGEYFASEGWYEMIDNWDDFSHVRVAHDPTHWMLLPEPPEDEL